MVPELPETEGLKLWPKVTGGKGYQVVAALTERLTYHQAHCSSRELASPIAGTDSRYTVSACAPIPPPENRVDRSLSFG